MSTPQTAPTRATQLADIVSRFVNRPQDWMDRVRFIHDRRWYERLALHDGYASSLAAASLQEIGLWRATDVIGGFKAWREAGLPVCSAAEVR